MKFSIRTKILGGYSFVIILFFAIILNTIVTQRAISTKLKVINEDYLPKLKMANSLANYNHLEETFDAKKIVENRSNSLFVQSVRIYHPRLLENRLGEIEESIESSLLRVKSPLEKRLLELVLKSIGEVRIKHRSYQEEINKFINELESEGTQKAYAREGSLSLKKKDLKSEISFLTKRLDNSIRSSLIKISDMERNTTIITTVLSLLAILIAGVITLFALYTLAPIRKLIAGVKKISEGDYNHRVDIKTDGEVKTLADEFNNMTLSILERNRALEEQQKKLIQSERMAVIGRMASHITHEVKNPLNSISLNTDLLEDELNELKGHGDTGEAFAVLKSIKKEIDRLSKISEEYLSFARMPKGDRQNAQINSVLTDLVALLKSEAQVNAISITEDYAPDLKDIQADTNQIKQAFLNIFKNAIEALSNGGNIHVKTQNRGESIEITFTDNGPGIDGESIIRIFDPFFSTKEKGTGLGLSLTQKIIREQGGDIQCDSEPGKGTRFTILFPCPREHRSIDAVT